MKETVNKFKWIITQIQQKPDAKYLIHILSKIILKKKSRNRRISRPQGLSNNDSDDYGL